MGEEILGKDISLQDSDDLRFSNNQDFDITINKNNLKQAIVDRLKTIKGELYNVNYGSELHRCIGQPRNDILKSRISGYIVEALKQEPRVSEINTLEVTWDDNNQAQINVNLVVTAISTTVPLNLVFPLFL